MSRNKGITLMPGGQCYITSHASLPSLSSGKSAPGLKWLGCVSTKRGRDFVTQEKKKPSTQTSSVCDTSG